MKRHDHNHVDFLDYYAYQSVLNQWNPSFKAIFAVANLLLCIVVNHWVVSIVIAFSMAYLIVGMGKLHFHTYWLLLKIPVTFMLLSGIAIAVNVSGRMTEGMGISLGFFYLYVTKESIRAAFLIFLKAFGAVSAMYMLTLTTTSDEVIGVLKKCHIPKIIVELMYLIYRYIFVLIDLHSNLKQAACSRLGECDFATSCRTFGKITNNLFIRSVKKAGMYYDAMLARAYDGELMFLEERKGIEKWQIAGACIYFLLLGCIICYLKLG